jgi:hypothetical protein
LRRAETALLEQQVDVFVVDIRTEGDRKEPGEQLAARGGRRGIRP